MDTENKRRGGEEIINKSLWSDGGGNSVLRVDADDNATVDDDLEKKINDDDEKAEEKSFGLAAIDKKR